MINDLLNLVGGFKSNRIISPWIGVKMKKCLKTPPTNSILDILHQSSFTFLFGDVSTKQ